MKTYLLTISVKMHFTTANGRAKFITLATWRNYATIGDTDSIGRSMIKETLNNNYRLNAMDLIYEVSMMHRGYYDPAGDD